MHYCHIIETLSKGKGRLGVIHRKSRNKIQAPGKLKRLIELINAKIWSGLDIDFLSFDISYFEIADIFEVTTQS